LAECEKKKEKGKKRGEERRTVPLPMIGVRKKREKERKRGKKRKTSPLSFFTSPFFFSQVRERRKEKGERRHTLNFLFFCHVDKERERGGGKGEKGGEKRREGRTPPISTSYAAYLTQPGDQGGEKGEKKKKKKRGKKGAGLFYPAA